MKTIRGDKITWVKGTESHCQSIGYLINQVSKNLIINNICYTLRCAQVCVCTNEECGTVFWPVALKKVCSHTRTLTRTSSEMRMTKPTIVCLRLRLSVRARAVCLRD